MNASGTAHLAHAVRYIGAIFAYGCSNGGMFVHHLARRLPEHFRAVAAGCGGKPHQGASAGRDQQAMAVVAIENGQLLWIFPLKIVIFHEQMVIWACLKVVYP